MEQNLTRKEHEQALHKKLIIKAAAQIFSEKGYEKTTLDEVAQLAELVKGVCTIILKIKRIYFLQL